MLKTDTFPGDFHSNYIAKAPPTRRNVCHNALNVAVVVETSASKAYWGVHKELGGGGVREGLPIKYFRVVSSARNTVSRSQSGSAE